MAGIKDGVTSGSSQLDVEYLQLLCRLGLGSQLSTSCFLILNSRFVFVLRFMQFCDEVMFTVSSHISMLQRISELLSSASPTQECQQDCSHEGPHPENHKAATIIEESMKALSIIRYSIFNVQKQDTQLIHNARYMFIRSYDHTYHSSTGWWPPGCELGSPSS